MLSPIQIPSLVTFRHRAFKTIRSFFDDSGYFEIDAPTLIPANAVETFIDPLSTELHPLDGKTTNRLFLMTSPEIHMKRLLAHGLKQIYFLGHVFRDRENSPIHQNEFTMLEWYEADASLDSLIKQCESLFEAIFLSTQDFAARSTEKLPVFGPGFPFDRISVASAWEKHAKIDLPKCLQKIAQGDSQALVEGVIESGESLRANADFEDAFTHIMVKKIEPAIGKDRPCVLFDWPAQTAGLAALVPSNHLFAQRFEIYWRGLELANAFAELSDPAEQKARFIQSNHARHLQNQETLPISEVFISDLAKMPPACGIAIGIDRLLSLIHGKSDLREVIPLVHGFDVNR